MTYDLKVLLLLSMLAGLSFFASLAIVYDIRCKNFYKHLY